MTHPEKRNPAASARDRLLALARDRGEDFQLVLTRYGLERLLYRLSQSPYRDRFILKGAMLFILWSDGPHRPTRDVDFLASGDSSEAGLAGVFRDLCAIPCDEDGVTYDPESVRVAPIRDDTEYGGMRVTLVRSFEFDGDVLARALTNTFLRRRTDQPADTPSGLSSSFHEDRQKNAQWRAFMSKTSVAAEAPTLAEVCVHLDEFLGPPTRAAREDEKFDMTWPPGGPWL